MIFKANFEGVVEPYSAVHGTQAECERELRKEHDSLSDDGWKLVYTSRHNEINRGRRWLWKKGPFTIMSSLLP